MGGIYRKKLFTIKDPKIRFFENIDPNTLIDSSICWNWIGHIDARGYGVFSIQGKYNRAHRYSYELHNNVKLTTELICHKCDNTICVNPNHLYAGTQKENNLDRINRFKTASGSRGTCSKLTAEEVLHIRTLYPKYIMKDIAFAYGVDTSTIRRIIRRMIWTHI